MAINSTNSNPFSLLQWKPSLTTTPPSFPEPGPNFPNLEELVDETKKPQPEMVLNVLANFLAGGLATGGEKPLDGMQPHLHFQVWDWVLQSLLASKSPLDQAKIQKLYSHIQSLLQQSLKDKELYNRFSEEEFLSMVKAHGEQIKALKSGESHVLYGGWGNVAGGSGHALMYEVIRNRDQTFQFHLYTATDFQLADNLLSGNKRLLCPIVRWGNIPQDYLLATAETEDPPTFLQQLFEMDWAINKYDKNAVVDENDILEALDYLEPFRLDTNPEDFGVETGQRAGTCVPSSCKAWARYQFDSMQEYKTFRLYFDLILIQGIYKQLEASFHEKDEKYRTTFIYAAKKLIGTIDKEVQKVDASWALVALKELDHWVSNLKKISQDQEIAQRKIANRVEVSTQDGKPQRGLRTQDRFWIEQSQYTDGSAPCHSAFPTLLNLEDQNYLPFLEKTLQAYTTTLNEKRNSSKEAAHLTFHHAIDQLPIPPKELKNSPWRHYTNSELVQVCQILRQMGASYVHHGIQDDLPPRRFATLFIIYATLHHIACLIDQQKKRSENSSLLSYSIPFNPEILDEIKHLIFHDRREFKRIEGVKSYFKEHASKPCLFSSEASTKVVKNTIHEAASNAKLWEALLRSDENLNHKMQEAALKRFPDYSEEQIQADFERQNEDLAKWYSEEKIALEKGKNGVYLNLRPKPNPKKLQNLPDLTKWMLLLQEFDSETLPFGNFLLAQDYPEINELRFFSFLLDQALWSPTSFSPNLKRAAFRASEYDCKCKVDSNIEKKAPFSDHQKWAWNNCVRNLQYLRMHQHSEFFELSQTQRRRDTWDRPFAEAKALDQKKPSSPLLYQTLRALSEWKLTPHQLLLEWSKNFEHLKDPELQTIFLTLFFRSPIEKKRVRLGVGELISQSDLLENIKAFVLQGLSYFKQLKKKEGANYAIKDIEGVKFLFEFACLCQKYLIDEGQKELAAQIDFLSHLNEWIDDGTISRTPRALLRLYRILHASTVNRLEDLSESQLHQILLDWMVVHLYTDTYRPAQVSPLIFQFVNQFMGKVLTSHRQTLEQDPSHFCKAIFQEAQGGDAALEWKVHPDFPLVFQGTTTSQETYHIDLRRGEFLTPTGKASRVIISCPWEESADFKRIFNNHPLFTYTRGGSGAVTFDHKGCLYRVLLAKYYSKDLIQRQWEGEWYQYIPPDQIQKEKLGLAIAFSKDYAVWAQVKVDEVKKTKAAEPPLSTEINPSTSTAVIFVKTRNKNGQTITFPIEISRNLKNVKDLVPVLASQCDANYIGVFVSGGLCKPDDSFDLTKTTQSTCIYVSTHNEFDPSKHLDLKSWREPTSSSQNAPPPPPPQNIASLKAIITSLKTGEPVWGIDAQEGKIGEMLEQNSVYKVNNPQVSTYYLDIKNHGLAHFEEPDYILTTLNENEIITKLHFVRYRSLDKNPLIFIRSKDQENLVWSDNQQYALKTTFQGFFKNHPKYIYLTPLNFKDPPIVLIPFIRYWDDKESEAEEWGTIPYFEYHVQQDRLIAQSVEGKLHLANLYYQDRKFSNAIELIRELDPIETLSPLAFAILQQIYSKNPPLDHPDAAMVSLQAAFQWIQNRDQQSNTRIEMYFGESKEALKTLNNLIVYARQCLQTSNHLTENCKLSDQEQRRLFQKLSQEIQAKSSLFNQHKIEYPGSLVEHITYWLNSPGRPQKISKGPRNTPRDRNVQKLETFSFSNSSLSYGSIHQKTTQDRYAIDCQRDTLWLTSGSVPFMVSRWPLSYFSKPKENGQLLQKMLKVAKQGNSSQRLAMLWKLRNWRLHFKGSDDDRKFLDLMIKILLNPTQFPDPYSPLAKPEEQVEMLKKLSRAQKYDIEFLKPIHKHLAQFKHSSRSTSSSKPGFYLTSSPWYHDKEPTLQDFGKDPQPLLTNVKDPLDEHRVKKLKDWRKAFLNIQTSQDPLPDPLQFKVEEGLLSSQEESYKETVQKDLDLLTADFAEGVRQLKAQEEIESLDAAKLLDVIQKEVTENTTQLKEKENQAEDLLNQFHFTYKEFFHRLSQSLSGVKTRITLEPARRALQTFDQRAFKLLNPTLSESQIEQIAQLLIEIEDLKSWTAQLKRMQELIEKAKNFSHPHDPTRKDLLRRLLVEFESAYHFNTWNPEDQVIFRIFCGQTGIIPFKKQIDLLSRMLEKDPENPSRIKDCVGQLIMGGGKTAVVAALLMQLLGRRGGKMAFFVVPAPLLKVVSQNLSDSLKKSFQQPLEVIQVKREDLTLYRLEQIETLLKKAQESTIAIIMPPSTLNIFELEFLSQCRKLNEHLKESQNYHEELKACEDLSRKKLVEMQIDNLSKLIQERRKKIESLARIITCTPDRAHALFDECDLIFDPNIEINFPDGIKTPISTERNQLVYTLFSHCIRTDLRVETLPGKPLLQEALNLNLYQKAAASEEEDLKMKRAFEERYQQASVVLARELAASFPKFQIVPDSLKDSFCRFLTGRIPEWIQNFADQDQLNFSEKHLEECERDWKKFGTLEELRNDCHLIKFINHQAYAKTPASAQFAELAALATHLLTEILPLTLWDKANRNYGPVPGDPFGKICPYDGVDSPVIDREFGYVWRELCYYYQWACLSTPEAAVILQLARLATEAAHYYMRKNGELFDQTAEYVQFQKLMGVSLQEFQDPESPGCKAAVKKAQETLRKDPKSRLLLQKELAAYQVKMHPLHLSANGFSLGRRVLSRAAMSGTPYNVQGYRQSMASQFAPDQGTEGKVLATLVKKVVSHHLHIIAPDQDFGKMLSSAFEKSPQPKKIRGFIDTGGFLSICPSNHIVAQQALRAIEEQQEIGRADPEIDTVLFFHKEPGEAQANTLYMWKMGASFPEKIGATTPQALKAKGLEPRHYFVLYDEKHVTGTDILQLPSAVNLLSFDPKILQRALPQGSMRLRQLLFSQSIEIVIDKTLLADLHHQGKSMTDLILQAAKNQSIRKTSDLSRYFRLQISDIFRFFTIEQLTSFFKSPWNEKTFLDLMQKSEEYFVENLKDNLFEQHGRLKKRAPTIPTLQKRLNDLYEKYPFKSPDVAQEVEALKLHLKDAPLPPTMNTASDNIGLQVAVEAQAEVEVNVEQEQQKSPEVEEDIEQELQIYENIARSEYRKDALLSYEQFIQILETLRSSEKPRITSLSDQLQKFKYGFRGEPKPYHKIFSEPIYGTESYFNTCSHTLPVFHSLQRPPTQILVVKGEKGTRWLLISEHECHSIKKHLKTLKDKNQVWLIQPNGTPLAPASTPFPSEDPEILQGLLEINIFNGNADWLGYYEHYLSPWLKGDSELKLDFLKLRTARHPHQRQILSYLPSILKLAGEHQVDLKSNVMLFSERAQREFLKTEGIFLPTTLLEVKLLREMHKIERLGASSIPLLGIDPQAKDETTQDALAHSRKLYSRSTEEELAQLLEVHSKTQIKYLKGAQIEHLLSHQLKWIHIDQIRYLKRPEQIFKKEGDSVQYFLNQEQVQALVSDQAPLIPFINPEFYPLLTLPAHVAAVPPEHLDKIPANHGYYLTPLQIKKGMTSVELVKKFKISFLPEQWKAVPGKWIQEIPPEHVTQAKIQEIDDVNTLQSLHQIAPNHAKVWIGWLKKSQIQHLTGNQIKECMTAEFVKKFKDSFLPQQWNAMPGNRIREIPPEHVTQAQIQEIDDVTILQSLHQIAPDHARVWIGWLKESQVQHLTVDQIKKCMTIELVKKFKNSFLNDQWKAVPGNLIQEIPPEHVTQAQIQEIDDVNTLQSLHQIAPDHAKLWIGWLKESQLQQLANYQLRFLQKPALIQKVSVWNAFQHLTPEQIKQRTLLQKIAHIFTTYMRGMWARLTLWIGLATRLQLKPRCETYIEKLNQLSVKKLLF